MAFFEADLDAPHEALDFSRDGTPHPAPFPVPAHG